MWYGTHFLAPSKLANKTRNQRVHTRRGRSWLRPLSPPVPVADCFTSMDGTDELAPIQNLSILSFLLC